uniref:Uncharacterized protein n=1 Tax=Acrobeloides nanus TaxID=290746 RepID=A0A914D295_9BILA
MLLSKPSMDDGRFREPPDKLLISKFSTSTNVVHKRCLISGCSTLLKFCSFLFVFSTLLCSIAALRPLTVDKKFYPKSASHLAKPEAIDDKLRYAFNPQPPEETLTDFEDEDEHDYDQSRSRRAFGKTDYLLPENFRSLRRKDIPVTYRLHD